MMKKISVLALLVAVGALSVSAAHKKDEPAKEPDATEMYDKAGLEEEKDKFKEEEAKAKEEDEQKAEDKLAEEKLAEEEKVEEVKDVADKVEEDVKKEDKEEVKD